MKPARPDPIRFEPIDLTPGWTPNWAPFEVLPRVQGARAPRSRAMETREGIGDRLRTAAFAEIQAYYAFLWGAERFTDAPDALRANWRGLALAEERHLEWLLRRMEELDLDVRDRPVSDWLWVSLTNCASAREFAVFMASAEERGRLAGVRFQEALSRIDPISSAIFGKIAEEEVEHIRLAEKFFPEETKRQVQGNLSSTDSMERAGAVDMRS